MPQQYALRCAAPAITDEKLARYKKLAQSCESKLAGESMVELITMLETFRQTPESGQPMKRDVCGLPVQPLDATEVERIWDVVPWRDELKLMTKRFHGITDQETRDAAFHLAWYGYELTNDREPSTKDKIA
jgi:hypothetical protein